MHTKRKWKKDTAITLLGIYLADILAQMPNEFYTNLFTVAPFVITRDL